MTPQGKLNIGWAICAVAVAALIAGYLVAPHFVRPAQAQPSVSLPFATSTTVGTSSAQIVGVNPSRRSISICNASSTAASVCNIAPLGITPATGATGTGVELAGGACFTPPANVMSSGTGGGAGAGWNGVCANASQTLIVLEW